MLQRLLPWGLLVAVCITASILVWEKHKEIAALNLDLSVALQKLSDVDKTVAVLNSQLLEKDKEIQALKLVQSQSALSGIALHAIGVHEGKELPGVDYSPWWAKCEGAEFKHLPKQQASSACHTKYAGQSQEKVVKIDVSDATRPMVLALSAYNKVHWQVKVAPGVDIRKVILGGYHAQRVSGLPETTIEAYTYESSPCPKCFQKSEHFYSYEAPSPKLRAIAGIEITSFQGKYSGESFSIFAGMPSIAPQATDNKK